MKTSMKLVVVAIALFLFATLAASCMNTPASTTTTAPTTTTEPPVTTTATVTTTEPTVEKEDLSESIRFTDKTTNFTGRQINANTYKVQGANTAVLKIAYSFKDAAGNVSETVPTNVGVYEMTAVFSFKNAADAEEYLLPEPMTATLEILPVDAQDVKKFGFEGVDDESKMSGYYYDGCEYKIVVGDLPVGLTVSYEMVQIRDAEGDLMASPVVIPNDTVTGIPTAVEAGTYRVTATFTDEGGNYNADSYPAITATLTVIQNPNQVLMYTPAIDGVLDEQYTQSAFFTSTLDETVDPETNCIFTSVTASQNHPFGASATVYYLWDGDYVYVCMVVEDSTFYARSDDYVAQPDPWKNDAAEIYYYFGGYEQPDVTGLSQIYPTYSAFTTDSLGRGDQDTSLAANDKNLTFQNAAKISAVPAQRSAYFNDILCATTHTTAEVGQSYTYTVEMAIPAKSESLRSGQNGEVVGNEVIFKNPGEEITAGEFAWVCIQVNDLSNIPSDLGPAPQTDKYTDVINKVMSEEWKIYDAKVTAVAAYSNRAVPAHYNCIQFSDVAAQ